LYDERYTTKEAKIRIKSEKLAGYNIICSLYFISKYSINLPIIIMILFKESSIDAVSAACLLERFLEDRGEGSIDAIPTTYPPPHELEFFDYNIVRNHIKVNQLVNQWIFTLPLFFSCFSFFPLLVLFLHLCH